MFINLASEQEKGTLLHAVKEADNVRSGAAEKER